MRTTATDRQLLTACAVAVLAGIALFAIGLVVDPTRAVLRHL